jgi:hypothetical protein
MLFLRDHGNWRLGRGELAPRASPGLNPAFQIYLL